MLCNLVLFWLEIWHRGGLNWVFLGSSTPETRGKRKKRKERDSVRTASITIGNINRSGIGIEILHANTIQPSIDGDGDSPVLTISFEILLFVIMS